MGKLNFFNRETAKDQAAIVAEPRVRFARSGTITLNRSLIAELGISKGSRIAVAQDDDNPNDWYLVVGDEDGFEAYTSGGTEQTKHLKIKNKTTAQNYLESYGSKANSVSVAIDPEARGNPDITYKGAGEFYLILADTQIFKGEPAEEEAEA